MEKKYFTLEEAQIFLPKVEKLVKKMMQIKAAIHAISSIDIAYYDEQEDLVGFAKSNREYHRLSHTFYRTLEELSKVGCIVKDLDFGLVDFYSRYNGEDILLCWKFGEPDILYWHSMEDGYAGRKPIEELKSESEIEE